MLKSYYDKIKLHQVEILSAAVGEKVHNCWDGVNEALLTALRDGTYRTAVVAIRAAHLWDWAHAESEEEEYKCSMGLKDCGGDKPVDEEVAVHEAVVEAVEKAADKVVDAVETSAVKA